MKTDRFWETFWLGFLAIVLISAFGSGALFFLHINSLNAAAVGVAYDPNKDPFESTLTRQSISLPGGYAYRNALPLGVTQWSWDSVVDWTSTAQAYEGSASVKMTFTAPWGGVGMSGFSASRANFRSLSLAVYPDASVGDLYVELYDSKNQSLGRQSLGWYTPSGSLVPNQWQYVSIPLDNLLGSSATKTITGLAISTKNAGVAYADSIEFDTAAVSHAPWVMPAGGGAPYNPFATSTPLGLPYTATFDANDFSRWYSYYGLFEHADNTFVIGPQAPDSSDAVAVMKSGKLWSDYKVDATLDWGLASVFSLLVRVTDASNFVSCAYSYYGQTVQIYYVKNGVSTPLGSSPTLGIKYDAPWQDVQVGASAEGNKVTCYVNGERELSATIPGLQSAGSVGLEAWDQTPTASAHSLKSFKVVPLLGE